jgi:uncharacterized membrane protein
MPGFEHLGELAAALAALALAVAMRPWRSVPTGGPPWPWLALVPLLALLWSLPGSDGALPLLPLSGACLLVLLAGWPLAMLALAMVAALAWGLGDVPAGIAIERLAWLGVAPGSLALLLGLAVRRWLPQHLMVYILGRGFFVTGIALALVALAQGWLHEPAVAASADDLFIARLLVASGEAFITGMLVAIFVAFRPRWLATYSDRLYLPR